MRDKNMTEIPTKDTGERTGSYAKYPLRQRDIAGYHEAHNLGGDLLHNAIAHVVHQSPPLGSSIIESMQSLMTNSNLSYRESAMVIVSMLTAMGDCTNQLKVYVQAALRNDVHPDEILDIFAYAQGFAGNPRTINALRTTWPLISEAQTSVFPESYTETLVRLPDHDTMVRDTQGPGVPIILIHALSMDSKFYKPIIPLLAASTDARVIAYDLRGHGHARGAPLTKSIAHLVSDLKTLLETLQIPQADVYGASYGGTVAQLFALDHPSLVRSLVPIATGAKATPAIAARAQRAEDHGVKSLIAESLMRWFHPEAIARNEWCVRYARRCVERTRTEEWAAAWRAMGVFDVEARLPDLKMPVMVLAGEKDVSSTPAIMKEIYNRCPQHAREYAEVPGGSHMMAIDAPDEVAERLAKFRRKIDAMDRS